MPQWNSSVAPAGSRHGDAAHTIVHAGMHDLPLFARVGAAIPTLPLDSLTVMRDDALVWTLIGGGVETIPNGTGLLYHDDGDTTAYETGAFATQTLNWSWNGTVINAVIGAAVISGGYIPSTKAQHVSIDLRGFKQGHLPSRTFVDGKPAAMACVSAAVHKLARPIATVVCTLPDLIQMTKSTTVSLQW